MGAPKCNEASLAQEEEESNLRPRAFTSMIMQITGASTYDCVIPRAHVCVASIHDHNNTIHTTGTIMTLFLGKVLNYFLASCGEGEGLGMRHLLHVYIMLS